MKQLFFNKHCINNKNNTYCLSVSTEPVPTNKIGTLAGLKVSTSTQSNRTMGLISIRDPKTNEVIRPNDTIAQQLIANLQVNQKLDGWKLSTNPVIDTVSGAGS